MILMLGVRGFFKNLIWIILIRNILNVRVLTFLSLPTLIQEKNYELGWKLKYPIEIIEGECNG